MADTITALKTEQPITTDPFIADICERMGGLIRQEVREITLSGYVFRMYLDDPVGIRIGELKLSSLDDDQAAHTHALNVLLATGYDVHPDTHLELYVGIGVAVGYMSGNHLRLRTENKATIPDPILTFRKWQSFITLTFTIGEQQKFTLIGTPLDKE